MSASNPKEPQRIAKLLARAGIASRREIERMIEERRVAIDGRPVETPATLIPSLRGVTVDGKPVKAPPPARLFLYHKPVGQLVTERDPKGRPTIYDKLPKDLPRLVAVGRLDYNTEGLLLLTTDGELKRALELPSTGVERIYRARAHGQVSQAQLEELIEGVEIDGIRYGAIDANLERRTGANVWIEMKLTEGKNREVRRVLEHLGLQVNRLIRLAYGPFVLGNLEPGQIGEVRQHDLVNFRKTLGKAGAPEIRPAVRPLGTESAKPKAARPAAPGAKSAASARPAPRPKKPSRPAKTDEDRRTDKRKPATDGKQADKPKAARPRPDAEKRSDRPKPQRDRTGPANAPAKRPRRPGAGPGKRPGKPKP